LQEREEGIGEYRDEFAEMWIEELRKFLERFKLLELSSV